MRRLRQILVLPTSGLRSVQLSLTWLLARDLGPISVIRPSLLVRIDISKTHEPAFGCNHYSRALVIHLADHRRIVSPSHVGGGGTIDVVEELGLHSVHALAVVYVVTATPRISHRTRPTPVRRKPLVSPAGPEALK